ncbi:hypothetical protein MAR_028803 [Mya arenaria]|uniref:Uncharacterized protein n=1 Tax=Mya arenaria TaxID=6604 RepID=A0ABY7DGQ0_MYAAR|nr:hypothetical protein MAR_028803 [Mya arenaria]
MLVYMYTAVPVDALLCSQCMSNATGSCALRAPDATPCQPRDHSDAGPANCMVARQIDRNGTVQSYIRGCSQVRVGTGCLPYPNGTSLCYRTCSEDGCNLAMAHDNFPSLYCAVLVFIYICLL